MEFALYLIEVKHIQRSTTSYPTIIASGLIHSRSRNCTQYSPGEHVFIFVPEPLASISQSDDQTFVQTSEPYISSKPADVNHEFFCNSVKSNLKSLTALHYSLSVLQGESILVINPTDSSSLNISISIGLTVFYISKEEIKTKAVKLLNLPDHLLSETGGLGVSHILDYSLSHSSKEKKDIIDCLGIRGKWAVQDSEFQIDPPESLSLFLRNASVCFFNEETWAYSGVEHSKFLHLLSNAIKYIKS